jgi:hypothetical protein
MKEESTDTSLGQFLDEPWAPVLGSGLTSALLLSKDASVARVLELPTIDSSELLAPEHFTALAAWTELEDGRVGLSLTRSGEIYLIAGGQLQYARRNSRWRGFPLAMLLGSGWFGSSQRKLKPDLKRKVLASLLDASAAHHGACVGIIQNDRIEDALATLVAKDDVWNETNIRQSLFNQSHFVALSRRQRLELLSMDGATLLDQHGRLLAAGAILNVSGGGGGGRTAAAKALSRYGIGIKVSQDGPVKAYCFTGKQTVEQFNMG